MILVVARNYERYRAYLSGFHTNLKFKFLRSELDLVGMRYSDIRLIGDWWMNPFIIANGPAHILNSFAAHSFDNPNSNIEDPGICTAPKQFIQMEFSL